MLTIGALDPCHDFAFDPMMLLRFAKTFAIVTSLCRDFCHFCDDFLVSLVIHKKTFL